MISINFNEPPFQKINQRLSNFISQSIILEDQVELNENVYSLMGLIGGFDSNVPLKKFYYNNLQLPDFWEVTLHEGTKGKVTFWGETKIIIDFMAPKENRFIKTLTWLDKSGNIIFVDLYNQYGQLFVREFFQNNQATHKFYYDITGKEFAQTISNSQGLLIYNYPDLSGYYPNKLLLLEAYLNKEHSKEKLITFDFNLYQQLQKQVNLINVDENQTFEKGSDNQGLIYDFSKHSTRLPNSYINVYSPTVKKEHSRVIFILTASDKMDNILEIADKLSEFQFYIGARTLVSDNMKELNLKLNIRVFEHMMEEEVEDLLNQADLYLDINHNFEVDKILSRAVLKGIPIVAFKERAHRPSYCLPELIIKDNDVTALTTSIQDINSNPSFRKTITDYQLHHLDFKAETIDCVIEELGAENDCL